jgi:hypothetical protein
MNPYNDSSRGIDCTSKPSGLETVHNRLRGSVAKTEALMDTLTMLEGRLLGGVVGGKTDSSTRPQPCGHIGAMGSTLEDLDERLERCQQIAHRLTDAI